MRKKRLSIGAVGLAFATLIWAFPFAPADAVRFIIVDSCGGIGTLKWKKVSYYYDVKLTVDITGHGWDPVSHRTTRNPRNCWKFDDWFQDKNNSGVRLVLSGSAIVWGACSSMPPTAVVDLDLFGGVYFLPNGGKAPFDFSFHQDNKATLPISGEVSKPTPVGAYPEGRMNIYPFQLATTCPSSGTTKAIVVYPI